MLFEKGDDVLVQYIDGYKSVEKHPADLVKSGSGRTSNFIIPLVINQNY